MLDWKLMMMKKFLVTNNYPDTKEIYRLKFVGNQFTWNNSVTKYLTISYNTFEIFYITLCITFTNIYALNNNNMDSKEIYRLHFVGKQFKQNNSVTKYLT